MDVGFVLTVMGLVLAAVALPLTYVWGRRSRQRPDLRFVTDFDVLMDTALDIAREPLKITYGTEELGRVSRTYLAIWNHRGDTVRGADIVGSDPLRLQLEDGDVALQAGIVCMSREQCGASVLLDPIDRRVVAISFDFLDQADGFVLEVVHRGESAAQLQGTIRGTKVVSRGDAELNPKALQAISVGSWWKRARIGMGPRRFWINIAIATLSISATIAMAFMLKPWRDPQIVPIANFQMDTTDGQQDFATAVISAGSGSSWAAWGALALYPFMLYLTVSTFVQHAKRLVPLSIVREKPIEPAVAEFV